MLIPCLLSHPLWGRIISDLGFHKTTVKNGTRTLAINVKAYATNVENLWKTKPWKYVLEKAVINLLRAHLAPIREARKALLAAQRAAAKAAAENAAKRKAAAAKVAAGAAPAASKRVAPSQIRRLQDEVALGLARGKARRVARSLRLLQVSDFPLAPPLASTTPLLPPQSPRHPASSLHHVPPPATPMTHLLVALDCHPRNGPQRLPQD